MKILFKNILYLFLLSFTFLSNAQICNQIENVCSNEPLLNNETPNFDPNFNIITPSGCEDFPINNSKWYRVKIKSGTELNFTIKANSNDDYDFVVYGPNVDCNNLENETAIRANFSGTKGETGLSSTATNSCEDQTGSSFSKSINIIPGEEYLVVINSYVGANNPTNGAYDLIWDKSAELECTITIKDLGADQTICKGNFTTLKTEPINPPIDKPIYQWKLSTDGGITYSDIIGENNSTLIVDNDISAKYKVIITDKFGNTGEDDVEVTFIDPPKINTLPDLIECENKTFTITANTTGADSFQWQVSTDDGLNWTDILANTNYSAQNTTKLTIKEVPKSFDKNKYRLKSSNSKTDNECSIFSNAATLKITPLVIIPNIIDINQCVNPSNTIIIDANTTNADTFQWQVSTDNGATWKNITVNANHSAGNSASLTIKDVPISFNNYQYRVIFSNSASALSVCANKSNAVTLTVNYINPEDIIINDAIYNNSTGTNSISINTNNNNFGNGEYQFALYDSQEIVKIRDYQNQPIFNDLDGGIYVIYINKKGCDTLKLKVPVIEFPNFFTPNNDGKNDTFSIIGINKTFFPNNKITILNRYGKIIYQFNSNSNGWNGLYKGKQIPSSDYWFKMMLVDIDGNKFTKQGHFSLLRK